MFHVKHFIFNVLKNHTIYYASFILSYLIINSMVFEVALCDFNFSFFFGLIIYYIGNFLCVAGFFGYFLGVFFVFSIMIIERSLFSCGKLNVNSSFNSPPSVVIALFASCNSSLAKAPFIAIKCPFILHSGKQYSDKTLVLATAL